MCLSYCANFDSTNDLLRYLIKAVVVVVVVAAAAVVAVVVADYSS